MTWECEHPFGLFLLGAEGEHVMLYDLEDEDLILSRQWRPHRGKKTWYAVAGQSRDGTWVRAHRLILGLTEDSKAQVDHINRNGLDNRRRNLRAATNAENCQNRGPRRSTGSQYAGVSPDKGRWRARIMVDGRSIFLGSFATEIEAAHARDTASLKHFGPHAYRNFA